MDSEIKKRYDKALVKLKDNFFISAFPNRYRGVQMNDAVFWGSIGAVAICIVIIVYLGFMAAKKINTDHSDD
ncbi:MAG: hypothetical protein KZQ64_02390 [gamma proteobacterium symbiont of Bathyaustriella thionipta]|nr:hypothetical protein [gamma proteobacterium symbiont of Bathyaustriella thionipta]MCU7949144.1 hypothetical protein [gamma proteobacterium symbiont of Bathyaustriella thionipta]MCU7952238.1 hypothetical protein [gamma proteobacterium symbiont of Bathyaustriella thionipta]MCU7955787.1 hypothetical protein [gamma proteobacterium symbiont of Bathyaustriella thionipta]MCU7965606.1 hypothetical protein [gamma proteobacterium symbiont of Bathyaustriella thionipta]